MSLMTASSGRRTLLDRVRGIRAARRELGVQRQFGHADHAIHRRADFVAHVGEEFALGAAGRFGFLFGLTEVGVGSDQFGGAGFHLLFQAIWWRSSSSSRRSISDSISLKTSVSCPINRQPRDADRLMESGAEMVANIHGREHRQHEES